MKIWSSIQLDATSQLDNDELVRGHVGGTFRYPIEGGTYKYGPRSQGRGGSPYMVPDEMAKEKYTERRGAW